MAAVQLWLLTVLASVVGLVEASRLYLLQPWSYPAATAEVAAARRAPWTVLVSGSSQIYCGILPSDVEAGLEGEGWREKVHAIGLGGAVASTQLFVYRGVREGHHPRAVVVALAPRDMTEHWDRQTLTVRAHAGLGESVALAAGSPHRRWVFPWYALTRDLGVPLQAAMTLSPAFRREVDLWIERAGTGWPRPGRPGIGLGPMRGLMAGERLGLLRVQMENEAPDAPDWIARLVREVQSDGGAPVLLVMPRSDWGASRLPEAPARRFEAAIDALGRRTRALVLRGLDLDPDLRKRTFYLDYVDHLSLNGARRLSRALGSAIGQALARGTGSSAVVAGRHAAAEPAALLPDGVWAAPPCVETAGADAPQQLLEGWWGVELGGRWTQPVATAELGWPGGAAPAALELRGFNWERQPTAFRVFADGRLVLEPRVAPGPFVVRAAIGFTPAENPLLVRIEREPPFVPANIGMPDTRPLGVFLTSACLAPD